MGTIAVKIASRTLSPLYYARATLFQRHAAHLLANNAVSLMSGFDCEAEVIRTRNHTQYSCGSKCRCLLEVPLQLVHSVNHTQNGDGFYQIRKYLDSLRAFPEALPQQSDAMQLSQDRSLKSGLAHHVFEFYESLLHSKVNGLHRYPLQPLIGALYTLL